ncbi:MAG: hypothetical protein Q9214_007828 [Letrouitia sp. 1 TL-2023]
MQGLFQYLAADEIHEIKNWSTREQTAARWVKPDFSVLMSATLCANGAEDWGYQALIQDDKVAEVYSNDAHMWELYCLAPGYFVYDDVYDDTNMAHTRFTQLAANRFIFPNSVSAEAKGERIRKLWKELLICRTILARYLLTLG